MALKSKKIFSIFEKRGGYSTEMSVFLSRCFERKREKRATAIELLQDSWIRGAIPDNFIIETPGEQIQPENILTGNTNNLNSSFLQ